MEQVYKFEFELIGHDGKVIETISVSEKGNKERFAEFKARVKLRKQREDILKINTLQSWVMVTEGELIPLLSTDIIKEASA